MRKLTVLLFCALAQFASAQTTSPYTKFGKITVEELQKKVYSIDSNANAVVLSDIGKAAIEGNSKGWFSISFKRHRVVHILNKSGYGEADVEIPLYTKGDGEEKLENIKAITYNLEGGKIVETRLDKGSIFKEKKSTNWLVQKFTMPNVKEGCIIEINYEVVSDYIENLDPWLFQGSSPVLWSEFELSVPEFFSYAFLSHGYHSIFINEKKDRTDNFIVVNTRTADAGERVSFNAGVTDYRWVMKDVPEIKKENFTSALKNHLSALEFQLASQNQPLTMHNYRTSWAALTKELSDADYFGAKLNKDNNWMNDELKPLISGAVSETEKAKKIFEYIRDNFTCVQHYGLSGSQVLKNVMKAKKGTVADINLLLTAMLRSAGLNADPVILSTTDHGYAMELYPMITSFNYVVTQFRSGNKTYYLDASFPGLGFGKLTPECYNGHARLVDNAASSIYLSADSLKERKVSLLFISNDEKGAWTGTMNQTAGYYESYGIRNKIKESGAEEFFKSIEKEYGADVKIKNPYADSLTRYEDPVTLHYDIVLNQPKEDILYINPLFGEGYKKNPFQSAQRYYPVEMPYTIDETFVMTMEVPTGYEVDELPKQIIAKMDEEGSAYFEYRVSHSGTTISLRTIVRISRTMFLPDEYETLREFFNIIVNKQNEQIVFKKKK